MTKKALNTVSGSRMVGIQEAVHSIDKLPLTLCSDKITKISLSQCQALRVKSDDKSRTELIACYRNRSPKYHSMSLEQYFYDAYCQEKIDGDKTNRILMTQGLNCRPTYPADFYYARGMLFLHKPWHKNATLDRLFKNKEETVNTFLRMLDQGMFPTSVYTQYKIAEKYSREAKIELVAKQGLIGSQDIDENDLDEEELDDYLAHVNCNNKTDCMKMDDALNKRRVNIGLDYDWSRSKFDDTRNITVDGKDYVNELQKRFYDTDKEDNPEISIPKTKLGGEYTVKDLTDEQRVVVLAAVDSIIKFLHNDDNYTPFRATVLGCGGTGKSFIINTIITLVRKMTGLDDTVKVAAPSGGAAYNVQGTTIHRLLNVDVQQPYKKLNKEKKEHLQQRLKDLLCLMIDERSMIQSTVIDAAENNLRECAFGGMNSREYWGGIPAVILFGDDYQLPPVKNQGAIEGFSRLFLGKTTTSTKKNKNHQLSQHRGDIIFTKLMTENVFHLTKNMRVSDDMREFKETLGRLRVGDQKEEDATLLTNLSLSDYDKSFIDQISNDDTTMWIYSSNEDKDEKNFDKLAETSKRFNVPVARINAHYTSNRTGDFLPDRDHFYYVKHTRHTDICENAMVAIDGVNFIPEMGLYNGARGKVVEIAYSKPEGPNDKQHYHLPDYVVVDFPDFKLPPGYEPWDSTPGHETVSASANRVLYHSLLND